MHEPTLAQLAAQYRQVAGDPDGDPDDQPGPTEAGDWTALADLCRRTGDADESREIAAAQRLAAALEVAHQPPPNAAALRKLAAMAREPEPGEDDDDRAFADAHATIYETAAVLLDTFGALTHVVERIDASRP